MPDKIYTTDQDAAAAPTKGEDALFKRYARKEIGGNRLYEPYQRYLDRVDGEQNGDTNGTEGQTAYRVGNVTTGLTAYAGTWGDWEKLHLLKRTGFGGTVANMTAMANMTVSDAVDAITTITATPSAPSAAPLNYYQDTIADPTISLGDSWAANNLLYTTASASTDNTINGYRFNSMVYWHWGLWLTGSSNIREKMVLFWYHFIPINYSEIATLVRNSATLCNDYFTLLRDNALGNFKTLIKAIAKAPAMLVYLGNHYSTAAAPNENFARELLELFMLGKLPTQNYTELDVQSGSKVLSGWRVSAFNSTYPFVVDFVSSYHNQTDKTFSSYFNNTVISNVPGSGGSAELDTYFDMLFQYQGTTIARYICRRLYRFFVYYDIDSNVETNVITPLAAALINNNWDMLPVVRLLLKSEHFFDMANRGVMIKSPFDMIAGVLNTLNVSTAVVSSSTTPVFSQYKIWENFNSQAKSNMEQSFCLVPNVSGWKAYYQSPEFYQNWINANTIQKRAAWLTSLVSGYTVQSTTIKIDGIAFLQQFANSVVELPDNVVDIFVKFLLPLDLAATFKAEMKVQALLTGQVTDSYWTTAWNNFANNQSNTSYRTIVNNKVKALLTIILQLAEFQLT
ncbi:MAG: DUF1800 family protein [Edaphocola sp.]